MQIWPMLEKERRVAAVAASSISASSSTTKGHWPPSSSEMRFMSSAAARMIERPAGTEAVAEIIRIPGWAARTAPISAPAGQVVKHARRQSCFGEAFNDHAYGERRLVRRLDHHRAACGQRRSRSSSSRYRLDSSTARSSRPRRPERFGPGCADVGLRARPHTAFDAAALLGVVAQHTHAEANFFCRIGHRLALFAGQHHRDRIGALLDKVSRFQMMRQRSSAWLSAQTGWAR